MILFPRIICLRSLIGSSFLARNPPYSADFYSHTPPSFVQSFDRDVLVGTCFGIGRGVACEEVNLTRLPLFLPALICWDRANISTFFKNRRALWESNCLRDLFERPSRVHRRWLVVGRAAADASLIEGDATTELTPRKIDHVPYRSNDARVP